MGIHNKPDKEPLDSSTKSGKLIDRVIFQIDKEVECVKSNLFDFDRMPVMEKDKAVVLWMMRVNYRNSDIVVLLGAITHGYFRRTKLSKMIFVGHPSGVWSKDGKEKYVFETVEKIRSKIF